MIMYKKICVSFGLSLVFVLPSASATWDFTLPGTICEPIGSSGSTTYESPGPIGNFATGESDDLSLVCGIDRPSEMISTDTYGAWDPAPLEDIERVNITTYMFDNSADEGVGARASACAMTGTSCMYSPLVYTSGVGTSSLTVVTHWSLLNRPSLAIYVDLPDRDGGGSSKLLSTHVGWDDDVAGP